jgi:transposase
LEVTMSNHKYAAEFREEAVRQVLERDYSVKEVADNLGVSRHSLYKWVREAKPSPQKRKDEELLEAKREVLKLRAELRRAQEERDILKKAAVESAGQRNAGREDISGRLESQGLSWTLVEPTSDLVQIGLRQTRQFHPIGEVLSQKAVGILIRASLPRALWIAEEDLHVRGDAEVLVPSELHAPVPRESPAKLGR